jgi:hypothetical protein
MAEGNGTPTKPRQFTLDGQAVDLVKTIQARFTPRPSQTDTIKLVLELGELHTRHLIPRTHDDLRADIFGQGT